MGSYESDLGAAGGGFGEGPRRRRSTRLPPSDITTQLDLRIGQRPGRQRRTWRQHNVHRGIGDHAAMPRRDAKQESQSSSPVVLGRNARREPGASREATNAATSSDDTSTSSVTPRAWRNVIARSIEGRGSSAAEWCARRRCRRSSRQPSADSCCSARRSLNAFQAVVSSTSFMDLVVGCWGRARSTRVPLGRRR